MLPLPPKSCFHFQSRISESATQANAESTCSQLSNRPMFLEVNTWPV
jgi:hypothetical protein